MYAQVVQERAELATLSAMAALLALRRVRGVTSVTQAMQRSVGALGAALRQLEQATPAILVFRPVVVPPAAPAPPVPVVIVHRDLKPENIFPVRLPTLRARRDPALIQQEINGCKALLLEIIRRAAYDWVLYRESSRLAQRSLAEQAYRWLFEEVDGHPDWIERVLNRKDITSFVSICEALDLDPRSVRFRIRTLTAKHVMSVGRPAEYRRHDYSRLEEASVSVAGFEEAQFEHVSLEEVDDDPYRH